MPFDQVKVAEREAEWSGVMAENSPGTDWYDWLAENEEIKGGKVRVLGLPRNPLQLSNSYTDKLFRPAGA